MRDPARIQKVLRMLEHYWRAYPDLRLGQIVGNAAGRTDPYYFEDDDLIAYFERGMVERAAALADSTEAPPPLPPAELELMGEPLDDPGPIGGNYTGGWTDFLGVIVRAERRRTEGVNISSVSERRWFIGRHAVARARSWIIQGDPTEAPPQESPQNP